MRKGQLINITDDRDLTNTSESYSGDYFVFGDKLVMPIINLDIIDRSVLGNETRVRIEFAYLILTDVQEISWIGERNEKEITGTLILGDQDPGTTDWFAHCKKNESYELKAKYGRLLICIPTISKFGEEWWTPWDTPNFKQNIEKQSLDNFANLNWLPGSVCSELGIDTKNKHRLEFTQGTDEQMTLIKDNWVK